MTGCLSWRGPSFWLHGWIVSVTFAVAPARPSEASYVKDVDPLVMLSGTSVICRARPPRVRTIEPNSGLVTARAVSTSPSSSESLSRTGSSVERPGRMPNSSSTASGGVFLSLCSGSETCSRWSGVGVSSSSCSSVGVWSQLLTTTMFLSGSHSVPVETSLRTMRVRFVRNTAEEASARLGTVCAWLRVESVQVRTNAPEPAHAP